MGDVIIHVDGATGSPHHAGIAAVAQTRAGQFLGWQSQQLDSMTNNEAEYGALLLGMALAQRLGLQQFTLVSDSEVVVRQMQGRSRVLSPRLKGLHQRACHLAGFFEEVVYQHVLRGRNRVADALAANAMVGEVVQLTESPSRSLRRSLFARFPQFSLRSLVEG